MSGILRFAIQRSVTRLRISSLKLRDGVCINRSPACLNYLHNNQFQTSAHFSSAESINKFIKKIDQDARRTGRISLREVENVIEEIKSLRTASSTQSLMVIRCCGSLISEESPEKRTQLAQETWRTFAQLGIPMDISHYNALLRVYIENEHPFKPTDILNELEEKGIEPNRVTYQRLITRYCQTGDIEGATRILGIMREKEMPINEVVFNALILGHSQANDMESAEGILSVMQQAGVDPSAETYSILINGYIKQGNLKRVEELLKYCESNDIFFIDKDYLEMVLHSALNNQDISGFLGKMKRNMGYNQDAINYIYRLVSGNKLPEAYEVLKTMVRTTRSDGTLTPTGNFFIAALVRNNRPIDQILEYCDILMKENLNPYALNTAMENSVQAGKEDLALQLFKAAEERNIPVRQHYFWPLLVQRGTKNDSNGLLNILNVMNKDYNMRISASTIQDYVIPHLLNNNQNISSLVYDLKSCGIGISASVGSIVINLLLKNQFSEAAKLASSYRAYYSPYFIRNPLIHNYLRTKDAESFTTLLQKIATGIQSRAANLETMEKSEDDDTEVPNSREAVGYMVSEVVKELKNRPDVNTEVEKILKLMVEKGVGISCRAAESIQNYLQDRLTQEISILLAKLTGDDLPVPEQKDGYKFAPQDVNIESLERLFETMKSKGESTSVILKQLFTAYGRRHDLEKLLKIKEELEAQNIEFTDGMKAYLIDTYVEHEKLDEAWELFSSCIEKEPDFKLHAQKMLKLALLLVNNEQYDKALEILSKEAWLGDLGQPSENATFMNSSLGWRILNHFAEKGDVEKIKQFFDLIITKQYCSVNNILLGPLIKVYIANDDFSGAMKEFEQCCTKYRLTPWKNELTKKCIETGDANNLQRLTDLSTQIHGEVNSLYDLMLTFLETGRIKQAKKILETPGLRLRHDRFQNACQKYQNSGAIEHLENLLVLTKDIPSMDRSDLYYNLLLTYDKSDDPQKASALWMQMQEENVPHTDAFLILLAGILKKHDLPVPFTVPKPVQQPRRVQENENRVEMSKSSKEFRKLLKNKNIDEAIQFKNSKGPQRFNNTDLSLLLEALLTEKRLDESKQVVKEILDRGALPMTRILKYYLINLTAVGDVEGIEMLKDKLTEVNKIHLLFNGRLSAAYQKAGRTEEYLKNLESRLDAINTDEEVQLFLQDLPKASIVNILENQPEYLPIVQRMAEKFLEKNCRNLAFSNILLMYHLLKKNYEEADKLWTNYFVHTDQKVSFKYAVNRAVKDGDLELLQKFKSMIEKKNSISPKSLGIVYGSIIKVLVHQGKIEAAAEFLDEVAKKVPIDDIIISSLVTLEAACHAKNIPFKYRIPNHRENKESELGVE